MFERTALVRDATDLHEVLEDVCRTISELLGYRAVVVNVYRPAFDAIHTSAAVGSADSVRERVGESSPREHWAPASSPGWRPPTSGSPAAAPTSCRPTNSTGTGSGCTVTCRA